MNLIDALHESYRRLAVINGQDPATVPAPRVRGVDNFPHDEPAEIDYDLWDTPGYPSE